MNDRLQELIRQRALVHEHLAWLDREIIAATGKPVPAALTPKALGVQTVAPFSTLPSSSASPATDLTFPVELDPVLAHYRQEPENLTADVKRGCLVYFCVGMAVMLVSVFLVYLFYIHRATKADPGAPAPVSFPAQKTEPAPNSKK